MIEYLHYRILYYSINIDIVIVIIVTLEYFLEIYDKFLRPKN